MRDMVARIADDLDDTITNLSGCTLTGVTLGLNAKIVELDLGPDNLKLLEDFLARFLAAGRPVDEHHAAQTLRKLSVWEIGTKLRAYADEHKFSYTKKTSKTGKENSYYYPSDLRRAFCRDTGISLADLPGGKAWVKAHTR
jgi:hypothetical protein